jgi:signal transduction histidine kinase
VSERLDRSDFFTQQERIADLADAGSDLTLAVNVERNLALQIDAGGAADIESAVVATDAAVERWLSAAATARPELTGPVIEEIENFAALLNTAIASRLGPDMAVLADELRDVGRGVDSITVGLKAQADDLDLYRALSDYLQLSRIQTSIADITGIGAKSITSGTIATGDFTLLRAAGLTYDSGTQQFRDFADPVFVGRLQNLVDEGIIPVADGFDPIVGLQSYTSRPDSAAATIEWLQQGADRLVAIHQVSSALLESAAGSSGFAATAANEEARSFTLLAVAVIALALTLAVIVGRSISQPLRELTANAERLSSEELPALVEAMRRGAIPNANTLTPIDTSGRDEIAMLATAISDIQDVTVAVAEEQGELLRRGISDMFVNLARRNQSLLDRQIEFIDQLEADEEDPDTLENLFRLDHLATRMRRNAESLLVLAGAESPRRRGQAVELVDVVRVAMGEIEDYSRIRLLSVAPATVAGSVAVDLAHLLSELMENASQFSPPDTPVEVVGRRTDDGSYQLTLTDHGVGLASAQMIDANHLLTHPPVVGLELGRSLGFTVVSRIAHRLGISARLTSSTSGGVTAVVVIPAEMTGELASTDPADQSAPSAAVPEDPAPAAGPTSDDAPDLFAALGPSPTRSGPGLDAESDMFAALDSSPTERQPASLPRRTKRTPAADPESSASVASREIEPGPMQPEREIPAASAASIGAVDAAVTNAGLIRRTPKAEPRAGSGSERGLSPAVRTPEEVRQMLSRYRSGLRKGRDTPTT